MMDLKQLQELEKLDLLEWLRETYPDATVDDITDTGGLNWARRHENCDKKCPGIKDCPTHGQRIIISRERGRHTPYEFVVRVGSCEFVSEVALQQRAEDMQKRSRIPERFKNSTFGSFITAGCAQRIKDAKLMAEDCATQKLSLVLMGLPGVGKTHLAIAMAHEYLRRGESSIFVSVVELLDVAKGEFDYDKATREKKLKIEQAAKAADFVVFDDLGVQKNTDWVTERLAELIDYRYREKKPMAITSNAMDMNQLATMAGTKGAMIVSRMCDTSYGSYIIMKDCADYRQRKII